MYENLILKNRLMDLLSTKRRVLLLENIHECKNIDVLNLLNFLRNVKTSHANQLDLRCVYAERVVLVQECIKQIDSLMESGSLETKITANILNPHQSLNSDISQVCILLQDLVSTFDINRFL
jgi:hypothetical protein